ncbi:hypothetical protein SAMN05216390_1544 [Lachnospiraceae bacterium KH1T2]|nr:hypothetical protein SAMN05216390_1544 [Lachnospiraceae bacterium KH1T2]
MCNLSESILEQYKNKGFAEGFVEGEERMLKLYGYLIEKELFDEIHKVSSDSAYRENLLKSLGL